MTTLVQPPHWPPCFYTRAPCSIMPSFINVSPIYKCQLVYVICKNKTNNINGLRQQKCISCSQKCSVPLFPVDEKLSSGLILFYSSDMLRVLESSTSSKRGKRVEKAYFFYYFGLEVTQSTSAHIPQVRTSCWGPPRCYPMWRSDLLQMSRWLTLQLES